jgi:phosphoribosylaminoimidazolecarboxamide formyltransferase/IMP cyclohydrolase
MAMDLVPVRRALISVSDKAGLAEFARALVQEFNVELISTGGTARFLREAGLPVRDVAEVTGFPEMMDGRVKTLHPKIHGGLLALRDHSDHVQSAKDHGIEFIDLVCINLYPFAQTIAKPGVTFEDAIENIDIGGPSMVRSAAKNHGFVAVVTDVIQYEKVLGDLREHQGATCGRHRLKLARKAFELTASYDRMIADYLTTKIPAKTESSQEKGLPEHIALQLHKKQELRYGENPHQKGALYVPGRKSSEASVVNAFQHHGKELSYINLLDADAAMGVVKEFSDVPAACVVKHATPCGLAIGKSLAEAFAKAYAGDPVAAFGGIVALNRTVDEETARGMVEGHKFLEVVVAPGYSSEALELLGSRWKNVRLLEVLGDWRMLPDGGELMMHKIAGGYLVQQRDEAGIQESEWKVVSARQPSESEMADLRLAWLGCKHVKSNAIVIARESMMLGSGAGQQDRVNACRIAVAKAGERARNSVAASDAFFPFPDGPALLLDAGVTAIVQPGGSVRDSETLDLVNQRSAVLVLTGRRHFKH